jgi:hypothetical protein
MNDENIIKYHFRSNSYISYKDVSLGIMIGSNKNLIYGLKGREYFIEVNLLFIHIKLGFIRSGHRKQR